jgi:trans-aconitate methyltransferase
MGAQHWNPDTYARNARFVSELGRPVVELLAPRPGERILDLGCGDGALTEELATLGCAVVGVDSSPAQVAAAGARGLEAHVADAESLTYDAEFDAVFSNAVLHWIQRPSAVITGVHRALRPGGRFVGEFGGHGNVDTVVDALLYALERRGLDGPALHPWYFPTPAAYQKELEEGGLDVDTIALIPRPTPLPGDIVEWLEIFAGPFADGLNEDQRAELFGEVREVVRPRLCGAGGRWSVDYVRLRFSAHKP